MGGTRVGGTALRFMTNDQYRNSVRDLLVPLDVGDPVAGFSEDAEVGGFRSNAGVTVSDLQFESYMGSAGRLAEKAAASLDMILGCDRAAMGDDVCMRQFIQDFGRRAYRRPLATEETQRLFTLYTTGKTGSTVTNGARLVIAAMLQSPYFLYHLDGGILMPAATAPVALDGYQVASRLSFFLWESIPDRALLDAAATNKLGTREGVVAQATRMIADKKTAATLASFHRQWLMVDAVEQLPKDRKVFPAWTAALAAGAGGELDRYVKYTLRDGDGKLSTLLSGGYTFANPTLLAFYGIPDPGPTAPVYDGWKKIDLNATQRAGMLTLPAFLAAQAHDNQTSPTFRGKAIREQLLCSPLPPPPPAVNDNPPGLDPRLSTRERFEKHRDDPTCAACHALMDPIGLGMENYDGIGRFRQVEANGARVDPSGEFIATKDLNGPFRGGVEMAKKLAQSGQVRECVSIKWLRYALGRLETPDDECTLSELQSVFAASGYDVRQLIAAIPRTDAFRYSRSDEGRP